LSFTDISFIFSSRHYNTFRMLYCTTLDNNHLNGSIPSEIGQLASLRLLTMCK